MSCSCTGKDSTVACRTFCSRDRSLHPCRYFSQKTAGERKQKKEEREKERDSNENMDELEFNPSERDVAEMNFARLVSSGCSATYLSVQHCALFLICTVILSLAS